MVDTVLHQGPGRAARAGPPAGLRHRRILVVEDDFCIATDMAFDLGELGAEVVGPVPSVDDALAAIEQSGAIDGAGLDINLNGEPVFPLADALRARGVPFVFASGYDRTSIPPAYRGVALCEKPVDTRELAARLFG